MNMKYILGIDIGTGSTKAVAVDCNDHHVIDSSQHFYPTQSPEPGYSEQDPESIWLAFEQCIAELVTKLGAKPIAISLSSAMHSLIVVDMDGKAIVPMTTWADSRSADVAGTLLSEPLGLELYRETGTPIHPMSPLCKIIWMRENNPDLFSAAHKFISIKEYIWFRLFSCYEIDHSIASCTGLIDLENMRWSDRALAAAGITNQHLSKLVSTSHLRKGMRCGGALSVLDEDTVFVIGASDGCLANLGSGAAKPGLAALTIGTSGALRVASERPVFNQKAMTFSYHMDEHTYINGGAVNNGGAALKWHLKNLLGCTDLSDDDYSRELAKIEDIEAGAEGLLFLPYLQGERAPIWDSKSCGTFFGIRLVHGQAHFTRAVIEGICFALNDVLQSLESSGQAVAELNVSGGFVSSAIWLQIMADITGKRLILLSGQDASAMGAAYLAVKAIGLSASYPAPDRTDVNTIEPDLLRHERYKTRFRIYRKVYADLKDTMHELYELEHKV